MSIASLGLLENINLQNVQLSGNLTLSDLPSAQSLATDANGNIIQGTATSSVNKWTLPGTLFTDQVFGDTTVQSASYAIIDNDQRVVNIFLNLIIIPPTNKVSVSPSIGIDINQNYFTNPASQPNTLPPPSALFQSYINNSALSSVFFFNDITLTNMSTNPYTNFNTTFYFGGYFVATGFMFINSLGTFSANANNRLVYSGTMSYMF
jgi:hypothetical protein